MAKRKSRPQKEQPTLDIVIPVYGQATLLQLCLEALPDAALRPFEAQDAQAQDAAGDTCYHVILVDDCGPEQDELGAVYKSLNGHSRLIKNKVNSGFARTVNAGVAHGKAPFILLLNSDCVLEPGAIPAMLKEFEDSAVGVVGCKLLFADNRWGASEGKIQHAGIVRNAYGQLVHVNLGWSADHPKVNERREMQMVTGACLMTRRKVWQQVTAEYRKYGDPTTGALNEVYDKGVYEDAEMCLAARAHGYKVIYTPDAVGRHYVGASITGAKEAFPLQRNALIFGARCGHLVEFDEWRFL